MKVTRVDTSVVQLAIILGNDVTAVRVHSDDVGSVSASVDFIDLAQFSVATQSESGHPRHSQTKEKAPPGVDSREPEPTFDHRSGRFQQLARRLQPKIATALNRLKHPIRPRRRHFSNHF
ncbi:MAG: hypothetical protein ACE5JX_08290 [Acidobacteriota bacterium]